jgi:hypothetical protein
MKFSDHVRRRWTMSLIFGISGFLVAQLLVWLMMSLVVFVALELEANAKRTLLLVVVQFLVGAVYLWSWAIKGMQLSSIDVILRDAGPIERELIKARISQEVQ